MANWSLCRLCKEICGLAGFRDFNYARGAKERKVKMVKSIKMSKRNENVIIFFCSHHLFSEVDLLMEEQGDTYLDEWEVVEVKSAEVEAAEKECVVCCAAERRRT